MDTPTKQRLVGAAVLVALAVIFLPMLVKGPAPDSGVSDVPLDMPQAPADGAIETRDLPLMAPQAGSGGALDAPAGATAAGERLPTVDTSQASETAPQPASVAGGDYAVHFGSYASTGDADTIVRQLRQSQLPGYREQTTLNGREAWRVRIGPYATRADAEAARLRAAHVRDDVGARVVVLDADAATPAAPATASASQPAAAPSTAAVRSEPLPPEPATTPKPAAAKPVEPVAAAPKPAAPKPVEPPKPAPAKPAPIKPAPRPAASGTGFAVQVGAFGNAAEATKLRDRLRAAGFTAFTETVNSDKGALTRVRVGPVLTRAEADRLRSQVSAKAGVSGMVRPHP